MICEHYLV